MPTLYAPPNWEPRSIPLSEVRQCLKAGYRETLPVLPVPNNPIPVSTTVKPVPVIPPEQTKLNLNTATLKDITDLPQIGTAIAKKIIAARPFKSVDDFCEKFPELDRITLEPLVSFDAVE